MSWNGNVPAGGSIALGFNGTYAGTGAPSPTNYRLNGATCA
jgi:endoglucanase